MRFTIRDVLWLTVLAAALLAWWLDRNRLIDSLDPMTQLEGIVLRVDGTRQSAEVALGSDDGVRNGDRLEVFRSDAKIGEISLLEVKPDTSRGVITTHDTQIQNGDSARLVIRRSELQSWPRFRVRWRD